MKLTLCLATLFSLAVATNALAADEIKGRVKSVDADKHTITLLVGDAEKTFEVAPDAKVTGLFGKKLKKAVSQDVPGGLKGIKEGNEVALTSEDKEGKPTVTQVKLEGLQPKIKAKAKAKKKKNQDA